MKHKRIDKASFFLEATEKIPRAQYHLENS